jgi:hypothetical protein
MGRVVSPEEKTESRCLAHRSRLRCPVEDGITVYGGVKRRLNWKDAGE